MLISMREWFEHAYKVLDNGWDSFLVYIVLGWIACIALNRIFRKICFKNRSHHQLLNMALKAIKGAI